MAINLQTHAFAGNPIRSKTPKSTDEFSTTSALESLKTRLLDNTLHPQASPDFKVLPFRKVRPLASSGPGETAPVWHLGWISLDDCKKFLANSRVELRAEAFVYLGSRTEDDVVYWAIDVSDEGSLVSYLGSKQFCFVQLRTLMVATDWADEQGMGELAIAAHARALLEWHNISRSCGHCGQKTFPKEAGRRKQTQMHYAIRGFTLVLIQTGGHYVGHR